MCLFAAAPPIAPLSSSPSISAAVRVCEGSISISFVIRDACSDMPARMIVIALDAAGPTGMESGEIALRAGFGVFAVT